jgi:hypothetical protein
MSREEAYGVVQRNALRAADERVPLHDLLATDPIVAQKLSLAALDGAFDDAGFLQHVPTVIERLDPLERAIEARVAARSRPSNGPSNPTRALPEVTHGAR